MDDCPGEAEALFHPPREGGDAAVAFGVELDEFKDFVEATAAGGGAEVVEAGEIVEVVPDGEVIVDGEIIGEVADPLFEDGVIVVELEAIAINKNLSFRRGFGRRQHPNQRRFPGSIGADQPVHVPRVDVEVYFINSHMAIKAFRESIGANSRRVGHSEPDNAALKQFLSAIAPHSVSGPNVVIPFKMESDWFAPRLLVVVLCVFTTKFC